MKKTNKTFKRFAAITSASLLAACAMAPVFTLAAEGDPVTPPTYSITINTTDNAVHTYEAYQIFTGVMKDITDTSGNTSRVLTEIDWGSGIDSTKTTELLAAIKAINLGTEEEPNKPFNLTTVVNASTVADVLATITSEDADLTKAFADTVAKYLSNTKEPSTEGVIDGLTDGYYLVQDASKPEIDEDNDASLNSGAKTRYILKVVGDNVAVNAKQAAPTVDKKVWDNEGGENGTWDETADWNINDKYLKDGEQQAGFKLIANIPANAELKSYDSYKIIFNDDMSVGVSFDDIRSVKVIAGAKEKVVDERSTTNTAGYEYTEANTDGEWTFTINDLTKFMPEGATWGETELTVEVIYNAHLNRNAIVSDEDYDGVYSGVNNNNVYLNYSNNPNWDGNGTEELGKTVDDTVGVFTYKVTNVKRAETETGDTLAGAKFKLYSDAACTQEVLLTASNVSAGVNVYIPDATGTAEMVSGADGTFNIAGLDAGTYYVKETEAPAGYNLIKEAKAITIGATHSESTDGANAILDLGESEMSYNYVNKKGTALPGTGGIGTTIFYLGGGAMAAIGGIYLISKRRMRKSEE